MFLKHTLKNTLKNEFPLLFFKKPKKKQGGYVKPMVQKTVVVPKREKRPTKQVNQKTIKQLLGDLYADKVYLERLLEDDRKKSGAPHRRSSSNTATSSSNAAAASSATNSTHHISQINNTNTYNNTNNSNNS